MNLLYWSIFIAAAAHVAEEYSTGFLDWFRKTIPALAPAMTPGWAFVINALFLLLCLLAALAAGAPPAARLVIPWLVMVNAALHVAMWIRRREYCPGLATAAVLYFPLGAATVGHQVRHGFIGLSEAAAAFGAAAVLHAIVPLSLAWRVRRMTGTRRHSPRS